MDPMTRRKTMMMLAASNGGGGQGILPVEWEGLRVKFSESQAEAIKGGQMFSCAVDGVVLIAYVSKFPYSASYQSAGEVLLAYGGNLYRGCLVFDSETTAYFNAAPDGASPANPSSLGVITLPDVTAVDNGKVLGVENGAWGATLNGTIPRIKIENDSYVYLGDEAFNHILNGGPVYLANYGLVVPVGINGQLQYWDIYCQLVQYDGVFRVNFYAPKNESSGVRQCHFYNPKNNTKDPISEYYIHFADLPKITIGEYTQTENTDLINKYFGFDSSGNAGYLPFPAIPSQIIPFQSFTLDDPTLAAQFSAILAAMKQIAAAASDGTYVGYIPMDCSAFIASAAQVIGDFRGIYNVFGDVVQVVSGLTLDSVSGAVNSIQYTGMDYDTSGTDPIVYTIETTLTPTMMIGKVVAKTATAFPIS